VADEDALIAEILGLRDQIAELPGAALHAQLARLARSLTVFIGNAAELRTALAHVQDDPGVWLPLLDYRYPDRLDGFLDDLDRYLHNFLAAAYSLARHSIVLLEAHAPPGSSFRQDYEERSPFHSPRCRFVAELRNVVQHARLPVIRAGMFMETDETGEQRSTVEFVLSRTALEAEDWTGPAKSFVADLPGDVRLDQLVDDYATLVQNFSRWFIGALSAQFGEELAEVNQVRRRLAELLPPIQGRLRPED
jgi:hypothetical protein